jgi:hypothetical protein
MIKTNTNINNYNGHSSYRIIHESQTYSIIHLPLKQECHWESQQVEYLAP